MRRRGPWRQLSQELAYENPWIRVDHHEVTTPAGSAGIYGVVHFKNVAIGILPLDSDGATWLVGQHRYPLDSYSWEIPAGGSPEGSLPRESAARELAEEVGLRAGRLDLILEMDLSNSVTDERSMIYVARDLTPCASAPEETEALTLRRLPFDELHAGVLRGEYRDSLTVAGVLKAAALIERGLLSW